MMIRDELFKEIDSLDIKDKDKLKDQINSLIIEAHFDILKDIIIGAQIELQHVEAQKNSYTFEVTWAVLRNLGLEDHTTNQVN